jgi:hypothetical protein
MPIIKDEVSLLCSLLHLYSFLLLSSFLSLSLSPDPLSPMFEDSGIETDSAAPRVTEESI